MPVCVEHEEPVWPAWDTEATTGRNRRHGKPKKIKNGGLGVSRTGPLVWNTMLGTGSWTYGGVNMDASQHRSAVLTETSSTRKGVSRSFLIAGHTPVSKGADRWLHSSPALTGILEYWQRMPSTVELPPGCLPRITVGLPRANYEAYVDEIVRMDVGTAPKYPYRRKIRVLYA